MHKTWLIIGFERPTKDDIGLSRLKKLGLLHDEMNLNKRSSIYIWLNENGIPCLGFEEEDDCQVFFDSFINNKEKVVNAFSSLPKHQLETFHGKVFKYKNISVVFSYEFLEEKSKYDNPYHRRFLNIKYIKYNIKTDVKVETILCLMRKGNNNFQSDNINFLLLQPHLINIEDEETLDLLYGTCDNRSKMLILSPWRSNISSESYFNERYHNVRRELIESIMKFELDGIPFGIVMWQIENDSLFRDLLIEGSSFNLDLKDGRPNTIIFNVNEIENVSTIIKWRRSYLFKDSKLGGPKWLGSVMDSIENDFREPYKNVEVNFGMSDKEMNWDIITIDSTSTKFGSAREGEYQILEKINSKYLSGSSKKLFQTNVIKPAAPVKKEGHLNHYLAVQKFISHFCRCPWSRDIAHNGDTAEWWFLIVKLMEEMSIQKSVKGTNQQMEKFAKVVFDRDKWFHQPNASINEIRSWRLLLPPKAILKSKSSNVLDDENTKLDFELILS